jgi:hypothetical protein
VCRSLKRKSATALCKLAALEMSVYNTALWRLQCSPWSLEMCRELDQPVNQLLRHITKNLPRFANMLLYGQAPGLNLQRLSDMMQSRKLVLAQRGITNPSNIAAGPYGLIQRGARIYGLAEVPGNRMTFGPASQYHWVSSLLARLDHCNLFLTTGGRDPTGTLEEQINSHINQRRFRPVQVRELTSMSIHTYGDLLEQDAESSRWTDTGLLGLNHLDQLLETRLPEHRPITLRPGTCWTVADGSVLEYIGKLAVAEGPELMFKRWTSTAGQRIGSTLRLAEDSAPLGAGTELLLRYEDVWPNPTATRAILASDASRPRGTKGIERTLVREFTQLAPALNY